MKMICVIHITAGLKAFKEALIGKSKVQPY
jgi:hypothetical protein